MLFARASVREYLCCCKGFHQGVQGVRLRVARKKTKYSVNTDIVPVKKWIKCIRDVSAFLVSAPKYALV